MDTEQLTDTKKLEEVIAVIEQYGGIDGGHHKQWVLDQVVRIALGDKYPQWVIDMEKANPDDVLDADDDPDHYYSEWDEGIAP